MSYDAGTAFMSVVPSFAGFVQAVNDKVEEAAETSAETFKETFQSIVKDLSISISLNDTEALAKLDALDADLAATDASRPTIHVNVDATEAVGELAVLEAAADGAAGSAGGGGGLFGLSTDAGDAAESISPLIPLVGLLGIALIPLAGLAGGALSTLPAILAGFGSAIGAIALAAPAIEFIGKLVFQPLVDALRPLVDDAILPGVEAGFSSLVPVFQALAPFIVDSAGVIGQLVAGFGQFLSSAAGISDINGIFSAGSQFFAAFSQGLLALLPALGTIGSQAAPIVSALSSGVDNLISAFAKWVANGGFENFVRWLQKNGPSIVGDIAAFVTGFGKLLIALAPVGVVLLGAVGLFGQFLGFLGHSPAIMGAAALALGGLGIALAIALDTNPIGLIITAIGLLIIGIVELVTHWNTVWSTIKSIFDGAVSFLRSGFGTLAILITGPFAPLLLLALHWQTVWGDLQTAAATVYDWLSTNIFGPIGSFFNNDLPDALDALKKAWDTVWGDIQSVVQKVWGVLKPIFDAITSAISGIGNAFNSTNAPSGTSLPGLGGHGGNVPGRAKGGNVQAGQTYTVGENGPETFVPNISGVIVPHGSFSPAQLAAMMPQQVASGGSSSPVIGEVHVTAYDPAAAATAVIQKASFYAKTRGK